MILLVNTKRLSRLIALSALGLPLLLPLQAKAGFQWVDPVDQMPLAAVPASGVDSPAVDTKKSADAPLQLPSQTDAAVSPVVVDASPVVVVDAPVVSAPADAVAMPSVSVSLPAAPVVAPPVTAKALSDLDAGKVVEGFGRDIPLVLMLKQVLPADRVYSFQDGVAPATSVTWKGGKGWRTVLADALHGAGLVGHEDAGVVSIARAPLGVSAPVPVVASQAQAVAAAQDVVAVAPMSSADVAPAPVVGAPSAPVVLDAVSPPVVEAAPMALPTTSPVPTVSPASDGVAVTGKIVMPSGVALQAPVLPSASDVWKAEPGEHLRTVIKRWCDRSHVELVWSTEYDYPVQASASFTGSFEEAVRDLLTGFVDAKPQPFGRLHDNPAAGQRTLVIETRGNTNGE